MDVSREITSRNKYFRVRASKEKREKKIFCLLPPEKSIRRRSKEIRIMIITITVYHDDLKVQVHLAVTVPSESAREKTRKRKKRREKRKRLGNSFVSRTMLYTGCFRRHGKIHKRALKTAVMSHCISKFR